MTPGRAVTLICALLATALWLPRTASPATGKATTALERDTERCRHANLDACYDAIRRNPRDPALLVSLGDALQRANRPAEAVRAYRRAAALAPNMHGIAAKISAAEAKETAKRPLASVPVAANRAAPVKRASNTDPVAQSH